MLYPEHTSESGAILGPPAIVASVMICLHLMPSYMITWLTVWIVTSFPLGILIGHCVLREK
jgi:hypothetical protein